MQQIPNMLACGVTLKRIRGNMTSVNCMCIATILYYRCDMTKTAADYDRRTIEGLTETDKQLLTTEKYNNIRIGRVNDPLITIDLDNWIPDELHLLLRVTDVLTRNLITAAAHDDYKHGRSNKDILQGPMVKKLLGAIKSCGVSFSIQESDKKVFNFTSLVGGDKVKLLKKLPSKLKDCQPADFSTKVKDLWIVRTLPIQLRVNYLK